MNATHKCPHCGHQADESDLIACEIYLPEIDEEPIEYFCDICYETKLIAARIVHKRYKTGKVMREDLQCVDCFEEFKENHHYHK